MSIKSAWTLATNADGDLRLRVPLKMPAWRMVQCLLFVLLGLYVGGATVSTHGQSVVINEFLASNVSILADEDGDFDDWIELYNPTSDPINLENYSLTDDPNDPRKWTFPEVTIQPAGFLLIWASGKDRRKPGNWDFGAPLTLRFTSAGFYDGNVASILVNGKEKSLNLRGLNIVRLDAQGSFVASTVYDTYESSDASNSLVRYLESIPAGEILIIAIRDEASDRLTAKIRAALEALGSEYVGQLGYWDSWGMICVVGHGKLVEDYRSSAQGPATGYVASNMTYHANFKIDKQGEYLALHSPTDALLDSVSFDRQAVDVSFGRQPDGSENWYFFIKPSPNVPNDTFCTTGIARPPVSSIGRGFYKGPITVALSAASDMSEIYYTLDGSIPTEASRRYIDPLIIEETQVLRARIFKNGLLPSTTVTYTYLINENVHLPVLSLVTDPVNLWSDEIGIYTEGLYPTHSNYLQRGEEWERPVSVEFFEKDGSVGFALGAGIRILGGYTRIYPKKSFVLHFRERYGQDCLDYPVFIGDEPAKPKLQSFERLVVRNAGQDGYASNSRIRDPLMHALWAEVGGFISAKRSVFVYLNGEPWGIYNLREHIDKDYLDSNYGITNADLLKEASVVEEGDALNWDATFSFFEQHDLDIPENYSHAQSLIELENFSDFQIFQIYGANIDLVANLIRFRPEVTGGKWQWVMWDTDHAFALEDYTTASHNTLAWAMRDKPQPDLGPPWDGEHTLWSTLMFRRLLKNTEYRVYFINRFADLLNTTLRAENVIAKIDALAAIIEPDISKEIARWSSEWGGSVEEWRANVQQLRDFAEQRPGFVREHIVQKFELTGTASLTLEPPSGKGSVRANSILPATYPWCGTYFQGVPVTLQAEPAPGYEFVGWSDPTFSKTSVVRVLLPERCTVRALFTPSR